jgi:hypothetical protein
MSMSSGRPLRWKLFKVSLTLVVDAPRPETTIVLGYGVALTPSSNVIGPPKNDPGEGVGVGVGVGGTVGVGVGVGVGRGLGVGVAALAVIVMLQEERAAPASPEAVSSRAYKCQVPLALSPAKAAVNVTLPFAPAHPLPAALSTSAGRPKSDPVSVAA